MLMFLGLPIQKRLSTSITSLVDSVLPKRKWKMHVLLCSIISERFPASWLRTSSLTRSSRSAMRRRPFLRVSLPRCAKKRARSTAWPPFWRKCTRLPTLPHRKGHCPARRRSHIIARSWQATREEAWCMQETRSKVSLQGQLVLHRSHQRTSSCQQPNSLRKMTRSTENVEWSSNLVAFSSAQWNVSVIIRN